ncbi:hypothetical protein H696_02337 [Fonticula alba]|uniref:PIN domain-containing protein n=1 Tax=Fonticula alba TaxID=691883 RepID=A0A058ZBT0_FONAL|nr:hypothetical protein H696_02337 [Fonticula alba]KCV71386.1 hypothetical protein H696_02337 [Fonticula alba]|eukprot:XP_009494510.1 hypothetical protein H696_02337 [Fonticula alba]
MSKAKKTRKFAAVKRVIDTAKDARLKAVKAKQANAEKNKKPDTPQVRDLGAVNTGLFFRYNTALGPPYRVLVDTNFINFSIQNKLELIKSMMDCLYAKSIPCITDCVMAEIEKLGSRFRVALRFVFSFLAPPPLPVSHPNGSSNWCLIFSRASPRSVAKDPRFERIACTHKGTYADDCLVERVTQHPCYIVATCDRDLRRRLRKVPGVPIMYISNHRYSVERMPEAFGAPPV